MSNIDPTKPTYAEATTQSVRDNFAAAKTEIEALQSAMAAIDAGYVTSVAGRTGAVVLTHIDITDWAATLAPYALTSAIPLGSSAAPLMDAAAAAGISAAWARADHVHPSDTSRLPLSGGQMTGPLIATSATAPVTIRETGYTAPLPPWLTGTMLALARDNGNQRVQFITAGGANILLGYAAEGTMNALIPTAAGRQMMALQGGGWDGSVWTAATAIQLLATGNWSPASHQSAIIFLNTTAGATAQNEKMRLDDSGALLIGLTARSGASKLQVVGGSLFDTLAVSAGGVATLGRDPQAALEAVTKQYADALAPLGGPYLPLSGGTLTGPILVTTTTAPLVINANPALPALAAVGGTALRLVGNNAQALGLSGEAFGTGVTGGSFQITGRGAQGTPAAMTGAISGQTLLALRGQGFGTDAWSATRAQIALTAVENWTNTAQGAQITFSTTAIGGVATNTRMALTDAGLLLLGGLAPDGTEMFQCTGGIKSSSFRVLNGTGPTITAGNGAPAATAPAGSIYMRIDGAAGTRLYVNQNGATTWAPVAGV